ncbi:DNA cytosine methyltransferase [Shewanella sp. SG44-6]|jgi:DNA (cytosine-5)-methyltransferase 1|uniref:DNA cytosine methyltransferase n=1 Tax=Shewanella sp. SG44-6 TaxID=2760959 RepID=UPI0016006E07|nr:DNA cytosine methyltransferase [Shewanella sp. SG44-6]MBB1390176.1 DNA cytosine methyltransferase [Shewanella sp. SG44-6]
MPTIINRNLGLNRGLPRVYLDGVQNGYKLINENINVGDSFSCKFSDKAIHLIFSDDGDRIVSRRKKGDTYLPLIDINSQELENIFDEGALLRITIKNRVIVIKEHQQNAKIEKRNRALTNKIINGEAITIASLCHGGGVLDRAIHSGLQKAGIKSKLGMAVEIEPAYLESSIRNNTMLWHSDSIVIQSAIEDVTFSEKSEQYQLLSVGLPCLGASKAGRSKGKLTFAEDHDTAGAIFFYALNAINYLNPAIVIIENVVDYEKTASFSVIKLVLNKLGYELHYRELNGMDFGAIENRNRMCLIAISKGLDIDFDIDSLNPTTIAGTKPLNSIIDTSIGPDSDKWRSFDYLVAKEISDKKAGKGFGRLMVTPEDTKVGVIGRGYAKCRSSETFLKHPSDESLSRIFTAEEHSKIKGVPVDLIHGISETVAHQILGQGVTFGCFESMAMHLGNSINQLKGEIEIKLCA